MADVTHEALWNADMCSEYLGGITRRHFLERVASRPGFPAPFELSRRARVWYPDEVRDWVRRNKALPEQR
jgi:predicted DNA-binding transcriptional regulator AlpA